MTSQPRAFSPASPTRPSLASCHGSWHGQRGCYDIAFDTQARDVPWACPRLGGAHGKYCRALHLPASRVLRSPHRRMETCTL